MPAVRPTRPGSSSWAYTRMAEKDEAMMMAISTARTPVQKRLA